MAKNEKPSSLSSLRSDSVSKATELSFTTTLVGGYDKKEVSEYIKVLKDNLKNAETLFKERLDEFSSMISMLTQERDKYLKAVSESELLNNELKEKNHLLEEENTKLFENGLGDDDINLFKNTLSENAQLKEHISIFEKELAESKEEIDSLHETLQNKVSEEQYAEALHKIDSLRDDYETLLKENDTIKEENKRLSDKVTALNEKNSGLEEENQRLTNEITALNEQNTGLEELNKSLNMQNLGLREENQKNVDMLTDKLNSLIEEEKSNIASTEEMITSTLEALSRRKTDLANYLSDESNSSF